MKQRASWRYCLNQGQKWVFSSYLPINVTLKCQSHHFRTNTSLANKPCSWIIIFIRQSNLFLKSRVVYGTLILSWRLALTSISFSVLGKLTLSWIGSFLLYHELSHTTAAALSMMIRPSLDYPLRSWANPPWMIPIFDDIEHSWSVVYCTSWIPLTVCRLYCRFNRSDPVPLRWSCEWYDRHERRSAGVSSSAICGPRLAKLARQADRTTSRLCAYVVFAGMTNWLVQTSLMTRRYLKPFNLFPSSFVPTLNLIS
jgi:hypothetical protein